MAHFTCQRPECQKRFWSKHSVAKFCSRNCAGRVSNPKGKHKEQKYSDEQLLAILVDLAEKHNCTPAKRFLETDKTLPDPQTYRNRFGSWNAAMVRAGLVPNLALPPIHKPSKTAVPLLPNRSDERFIPTKLRFLVLKRDGFRCQYCGGTPQEGYILHIDHKIPFSKGGKTEINNLITACVTCNLGKGTLIIE